MITENSDLIITGAAGILSTIGGWFVGRRKKQVETDKNSSYYKPKQKLL